MTKCIIEIKSMILRYMISFYLTHKGKSSKSHYRIVQQLFMQKIKQNTIQLIHYQWTVNVVFNNIVYPFTIHQIIYCTTPEQRSKKSNKIHTSLKMCNMLENQQNTAKRWQKNPKQSQNSNKWKWHWYSVTSFWFGGLGR